MKVKEFNVISEYTPIRQSNGDKINLHLEDEYVYLQSVNLKEMEDIIRLRKCYKILNKKNKKFILRKVKAKAIEGLNSEKILINYQDSKELSVKNNDEISLKKANFIEKITLFYLKHPDQNIRMAYIGLTATILIGLISLFI